MILTIKSRVISRAGEWLHTLTQQQPTFWQGAPL